MDDIKISIICNAYNHAPYIAKALDGFVMQKTNFGFEVLIHDDASTDNTADIIREYEAKYPNLIKPVYQTENQYSKGCGTIGRIQRERAKGKYFAFCEGDDYWTDPNKLQKQYDFLENHPEIDMCAHRASCEDGTTKAIIGAIAPKNHNAILSAEEVIKGGGEYIATNSLVYRKELDFGRPVWRTTFPYDYSKQIHGALRGGIAYLNDDMSVYRAAVPQSWTSNTYKNINALLEYMYELVDFLNLLNSETEYKYKDTIEPLCLEKEFYINKFSGNFKLLTKGKFKSFYKTRPIKERVYIKAAAICPAISDLKNKLKGRH